MYMQVIALVDENDTLADKNDTLSPYPVGGATCSALYLGGGIS